jgi:hypothetical protein
LVVASVGKTYERFRRSDWFWVVLGVAWFALSARNFIEGNAVWGVIGLLFGVFLLWNGRAAFRRSPV